MSLDVYCDQSQIATSPSDVTLYFFQRDGTPNSTKPPVQVACVRMSLEAAKLFAIQLKKIIKSHEDQQGAVIHLHPQITSMLGLSLTEDW